MIQLLMKCEFTYLTIMDSFAMQELIFFNEHLNLYILEYYLIFTLNKRQSITKHFSMGIDTQSI